MKLHVALSLAALVPSFTSSAHAAPGLHAEPDAPSKVIAPAAATLRATSAVADNEGSRAYLSASLTSLPQVFVVPLFVRAELGLRLGDSPAYVHALGAAGIAEEVRGGVELQSSGSTRVFGGLDAGTIWSPESDAETSLLTVVPRVGIDAGQTVFFRATVETALWFGTGSDELPVIVMMSAGLGVRL